MQKLVSGVHRFRSEAFGKQRRTFERLATDGQSPDTLFITCSDSRIVPNLITSSEPGDLFIVRNVGNIIPPFEADDLPAEGAAIEFAVGVLGIQEIVVCGHSSCGAMKALIANKEIELPSLRGWLEHAKSNALIGTNPSPTAVAKANVLQQVQHIATYPVVKEKAAVGNVHLHAWFYDVGTGQLDAWNP